MNKIKGESTQTAPQNMTNSEYSSQLRAKMNQIKGIATPAPKQYADHGTMAQQNHANVQQKQQNIATANKVMTNYLNNGGSISTSDYGSLAQLLRENGKSEKEIEYLVGRQQAANSVGGRTSQIYGNNTSGATIANPVRTIGVQVAAQRNPIIVPGRQTFDAVNAYDTSYGKNEALETINSFKGQDINANVSKFVDARANLEKAKKEGNTKEITKNQAIINAFTPLYKENYDKSWDDEKMLDEKIKSLSEHVSAAVDNLNKDIEKLNTSTGDNLRKAYEEYQKDLETYNTYKERYDEAITYDEIINKHPIKDFAKGFPVGATGAMAKGMTYGKLTEDAVLDFFGSPRNPANINAKSLLNYNNENYEIEKYNGSIAREAGDTDVTGEYQNMSPAAAFQRLKTLAENNPEYRGLQTLLHDISTHTYKGTEEDLAKELDRISKEMYQGWKNTHTQAGYDWEEALQTHNERAYGDNPALKGIVNSSITGGEMIPSMVAGTVGQPASMAALFMSAAGGSADQAIKEGATINQGTLYGALSGATEVGTEMIGGDNVNRALGIKGQSLLSKVFGDSIKNMHIESKAAKVALKYIFDVAGEMTEEGISAAIEPFIKTLVYDPNAMPDNVGEYFKDIMDAAVEAIPSTVIMSGIGAGGKVLQVNRAESALIKNINEDTRLTQATKVALIDEVKKAAKDVKAGLTEETGNYKYDIMQNMDMNKTASKVAKDYEAYNLKKSGKEDPNSVAVKAAEVEKQGFKVPKETSDLLQYIQDTRGTNIVFDTTIDGNGVYDESTRTIYLNPKSERAVEFTLAHELAHDLKAGNAADYLSLQKSVLNYAKKLENYDESRAALDATYKAKLGEGKYNIDDEVTNDILGQVLGNQDFLNTLAQENPNVFQRLWNWIKNVLFDGSKSGLTLEQRRMLNKYEQGFKKAYNSAFNGRQQNENVQHSVDYDVDGKPFVIIDDDILANVPEKDWLRTVKEVFKTKFPDGIDMGIFNIPITSDGRREFTSSKYTKKLKKRNFETYSDKLRMANNADEIVQNAYGIQNEDPKHPRKDNIGSFNRGTIDVRVGRNDYEVEVVTGITNRNNEIFYDIVGIKKKTSPIRTSTANVQPKIATSSIDNSIPSFQQNVNNSLSEATTDSQGRQLTKEQQEFFKDSKARDKDGNLEVYYHGTPTGGFTEFKEGAYLTTNKQYATQYTRAIERGDNPQVYEVYANIRKPFTLEDKQARDIFIKEYIKGGYAVGIDPYETNQYYDGIEGIDWNEGDDLFRFLKENYPDYDSIILEERYNDNGNEQSLLVFNPNQIKNVDNTRPTSNPDIRYSLSENNDKTLVATHNLSEQKLKGMLELGGFPVPSIAISDINKLTPTQFGDITVLFNKDTINPTDRRNEVYDRDVWSPTFPTIGYDISDSKIYDMMEENGIKIDYKDPLMASAANRFFDADNLKDFISNYDLDTVLKDMKKDDRLQYVYAKLKLGLEPVMRDKSFSYTVSNDTLQKFIDYIGEDADLNINDSEFADKYKDKIVELMVEDALQEKDAKGKPVPEELKDTYKKMLTEGYQNNRSKIVDFIYDANKMRSAKKYNETLTVDEDATKDKVANLFSYEGTQEAYEKWIDDTFGKMFANTKKGIRNDKDWYTPSGNRRSFGVLYDDYNLNNIVRALTKQNTKGGQKTLVEGGFGKTAAQLSKRFTSISDIRNSKGQLMNSEEMEKAIEPIKEKFSEDAYKLSDYTHDSEGFYTFDNVHGAIEEFAQKYSNRLTIENFKKILDDYQAFNTDQIPDDVLNNIIDDLEQIKNIPTDYFEAKPQRAVGLDEIASVLVPKDISDQTRKMLEERGVNYIEYDPDVEGDRAAKYKQAAQNVLFSKSNPSWQGFLEKNFNWSKGKKTKFETLPSKEELQKQEQKKQKKATQIVANEPIVKMSADKSLDDLRDFKEVGNKKVHAYQYDNPEVKPFFQHEAQGMLNDLDNAIKGERSATWDNYGELHYTGVTRETTEDIANLLDGNNGVKLSYDDIRKGLEAIIKDNGAENIAAAKRIEMALDRRLREGFTDSYGTEYEPNENYKNFLEGKDYIDPAEYEEQLAEKKIAEENEKYEQPEEEDIPLFSLSEEQQKEVSDYADKLEKDTTLDEDFATKIFNRLNKVDNYEDFKKIKQEVDEYKGKKRRWTGTAKKNELVQQFLDVKDLTYIPDSNKRQLSHAQKQIDRLGYEDAMNYIDNKIRLNERVTADDIAMGELLIQEAIKNKDYDKAQDLIADVAILGTELGQAVQALSMISRLTPEGQLKYLNKVLSKINEKIDKSNTHKKESKKIENITIDKDTAANILKAEDAVELQNAVDEALQKIADKLPVSFSDKVAEWRYLAMLANPRTHIRNVLANIAMRGTYETKNVLQRTIETLASPLLDERTRTFKKATADVKKFAEQSTKDNAARLSGGNNKTMEARLKEMRKVFKFAPIEKLRKLNSNMLSLEDNVFTTNAYKANLAEYLTANGIKTQHDIDMNPEIVEKGIKFATEEAWKTTFHQMSKAATALSKLENVNEFSKLFVGGTIPFKKTPINIAKTGASYSPLGLLETLTAETYKLKTGRITANEYIDRISQGLTGSMIFGLGTLLSKMGILRGSADKEKDDEYKENIGQTKGYSIRLGNDNYDISWLSPTAMPLLMGAELVNTTNGEQMEFGDIMDALGSTINPLSEMSFLSGVNSTLKSYSNSKSPYAALQAIGENSLKSYFGQFVPTIGGQINKVIDPTQRVTTPSKNSKWRTGEGWARQQINKIPGASYLLEPKTDVWGNEVKRRGNVATRAFDAFVNPGVVTEDKTTKIDEQILDLLGTTGDKNIIPKIPSNYFDKQNFRYDMSAKEYTKYKKDYGTTAYKNLEELFKSKDYKEADEEDKVKMIKDVYSNAQQYAREEYGITPQKLVNKYGEAEAAQRLLDKDLYKKYDQVDDDIPLVDFYNAYIAQKNAKSDKDENGKTIKYSEAINQKKAIDDVVDLDEEKRKKLYGIFKINEKVW